MLDYLDRMKIKFGLFDAPLVNNFHKASWKDLADLGQIFSGSLVQADCWNAVTLVMNHDTQPGQSLEVCRLAGRTLLAVNAFTEVARHCRLVQASRIFLDSPEGRRLSVCLLRCMTVRLFLLPEPY
jgi:hypothetical protein